MRFPSRGRRSLLRRSGKVYGDIDATDVTRFARRSADITLPRSALEPSVASMPMGLGSYPPPQRMQLDTKGCQSSPIASDVESLSVELRRGPSVQTRRPIYKYKSRANPVFFIMSKQKYDGPGGGI